MEGPFLEEFYEIILSDIRKICNSICIPDVASRRVLFEVLISVWLLGGATAPLLSWLRIRKCEPEQLKQLALTLEPAGA